MLLQAVKGLYDYSKVAWNKAKVWSQTTLKSTTKQVKVLNQKINKHLHSFHALHSSTKMGRLDYAFKFSTEIIVVAFSLVVIMANAAGASNLNSMNTNLFAKFLSYHPKSNLALYDKATTVKTVVDSPAGGLIHAAAAQVTLVADGQLDPSAPSSADSDSNSSAVITDNSINEQIPDSVSSLIADQIKVYVTKSGDTLASIAASYGISQNTIIWANNLPNTTIKPGWDLVILPTSGVLHKVTTNETLPDIAKKYSADEQRIISYNNLTDEDDINPGDLLIIPDGVVPAPPTPVAKPAPSIKHVINNKVVYEPATGENLSGGHLFPYGECTYWVALKMKEAGKTILWGGNAKSWIANSQAYGAVIGHDPVVGSIVQTKESTRYGHVAYVVAVSGNSFEVSEMNYKGKGVVDTRWISDSDPLVSGFIYW